MDVKTLKMLLGIDGDDTSKDALLTFTLANVEEIIKNYCHVRRVPDGLSHTALRMAVDLYRNEGFGGSHAGSGKATIYSTLARSLSEAMGSWKIIWILAVIS